MTNSIDTKNIIRLREIVIEGKRYYVPVEYLITVISNFNIIPIPNVSETILGMISFKGRVAVILNIEKILDCGSFDCKKILIFEIDNNYFGIPISVINDNIEINVNNEIVGKTFNLASGETLLNLEFIVNNLN